MRATKRHSASHLSRWCGGAGGQASFFSALVERLFPKLAVGCNLQPFASASHHQHPTTIKTHNTTHPVLISTTPVQEIRKGQHPSSAIECLSLFPPELLLCTCGAVQFISTPPSTRHQHRHRHHPLDPISTATNTSTPTVFPTPHPHILTRQTGIPSSVT